MKVTWEMKYGELRKELKDKYRQKMKQQEQGIVTSDKPSSVNKSCSSHTVDYVDHQLKVEKIRERRDYSFLFSDHPLEPNPKPSNAAPKKTSHNSVVGRREIDQVKKPVLSSLKIKLKYNKIGPKNITSQNGCVNDKGKTLGSRENKISRQPNLKSVACKKPNLEQKQQPLKRLRRYRADDEEESEKALRMIRQMYNTKRFVGRDDRDTNMETNYEELLKEENKSAQIAREEDKKQLRLIMEEKRREKNKKRKIRN